MVKLYKIPLIIILFLSFNTNYICAQLAVGMPFKFNVSAATPPAFPTTGDQNIVVPAANIDEWSTLISPIGFSFVFAGQTYTKVVISTNGWCALIPNSYVTIPPNFSTALPLNQLSNNNTTFPLIAPLWDDLSSNVFSWNYTGGALWIRWNLKWDKNNAAAASPLFYLKLDATNNSITFYYANNTTYVPSNPSASIGISGPCTGDFYSVSTTSSNSAYVDSVTENTNIGQGGATTMRPYNCSYIFTPISSNNTCVFARELPNLTSQCNPIVGSTINALGNGNICGTTDQNSVYFKVFKPAGITSIKIETSPAICNSATGTSMEVFSGCSGSVLGCSTTGTINPGFAELSLQRPCEAETLIIHVSTDNNIPGKFSICAKTDAITSGNTCANSFPICALPFNGSGFSTAGMGNDYDSLSSPCHSGYLNGEDYVFSYTPQQTECVNITVTSTGNNPGLFLYDNCPNNIFANCVASGTSPGGTFSINASLIDGLTYYIVVDNSIINGNTNIPFDISLSSAVNSTSALWTGSINDNFDLISNWADCSPKPSCGVDVSIPGTAVIQPVIYGNDTVQNITINSGATLTIQSGGVLNICGNFINNGNLACHAGSTVNFIGTTTQTVNGSLTGANKFSNFFVTKSSGSVQLLTDMDVGNNFIIANQASIFNISGKYLKVGGNFTNYNTSTFIGQGGSTVEFNGQGNQNYTNTNGTASLNRVIINKGGGKLYLTGQFGNLNVDSTLTLLSGNIVTSSTLEVNIKRNTTSAITSYSANSYIDGRLRRKLFLGSLDFPIGDSLVPNQGGLNGYELANITFTSSTVVPDILAWFSPWSGSTPTINLTDQCGQDAISYNLPILNNGYWSFQRSSASFNGAYNVTLYNTGGNNNFGSKWTVGKAGLNNDPALSSSWTLIGTCTSQSTYNATKRNSFNNPVLAGGAGSFNAKYASIQSNILVDCSSIVSTTNSTCNGLSNGSAEILVNFLNAGTNPTTFQINGGAIQSSGGLNPFNIPNLPAGQYQVIYSTNGSCTDTADFTISQQNIDDNNLCTNDYCDSANSQVVHELILIDDNDICTNDFCDPSSGSVTHLQVNTNDNNACTIDGCNSNGIYHTPLNVDDNNLCTDDVCDPATGNVSHSSVNTNDNNACTNDLCDMQTGLIIHQPVNTDDGNSCTIDICNSQTGNITHNSVNTNDNNACTSDFCDPSTGIIQHTAINIDDNDLCTQDQCDPVSGISHSLIPVTDGNLCTTDGCIPLTGIYHVNINIDDNNPCTNDACNPNTGSIVHSAVNPDDNNVCTTDGCDVVNGIYHTNINFSDGNVCTTDGCDALTGIYHLQINNSDNNLCTSDFCDPVAGVFHIPVPTTDNNICTDDVCDPLSGQINHPSVNVNDNNVCTSDGCNPQTGIYHLPVNPDDNNSCTIDGCDPLLGVYHNTQPEICGNGIDDNCNGQTDENCNYPLSLKVYFEGYYQGNGQMAAAIDPVLFPLLSDTLLVELRNPSYPYNVVFFTKDVIDINGNGTFSFPLTVLNNSYFIVVRQRNTIETWSSQPVFFSGPSTSYSFANSVSKAFGNNLANLGDGNFALWSGDISHSSLGVGFQDQIVESQDYVDMENAVTIILTGYVPQDLTGDGVVEATDYLIEENNVRAIIFTIKP
jgi:hypothetical protein